MVALGILAALAVLQRAAVWATRHFEVFEGEYDR